MDERTERRRESYKSGRTSTFQQESRNKRQELVVSLRKEKREKASDSFRDFPPATLPELLDEETKIIAYNSEIIRRFISQVEEQSSEDEDWNENGNIGPFPKWTTFPDAILSIKEILKKETDGNFAKMICSRGLLYPVLSTFSKWRGSYSSSTKSEALASVLNMLAPKYMDMILNCNNRMGVTLLFSFLVSRKPWVVCSSLDTLRTMTDIAAPPMIQHGLLLAIKSMLKYQVPNEVLARVAALVKVLCNPQSLATKTLKAYPTIPPIACSTVQQQLVYLVQKLLLNPSAYFDVIQTTLEATISLLKNLEDVSDSDRPQFLFTPESPDFSSSSPVLARLVELISFPSQLAKLAITILSELAYDSNICTSKSEEYYDGLLQANFLSRLIQGLERTESFSCFPNVECLTLLGKLMTLGNVQTKLILDHPTIVKFILKSAQSSKTKIASEAIWTIGIIAENMDEDDMYEFLDLHEVLHILCDHLNTHEHSEIILFTLQTILAFLKSASESTVEYIAQSLESYGGIEKIDFIALHHPKSRIKHEAEEISDILSETNKSDCDSTSSEGFDCEASV